MSFLNGHAISYAANQKRERPARALEPMSAVMNLRVKDNEFSPVQAGHPATPVSESNGSSI